MILSCIVRSEINNIVIQFQNLKLILFSVKNLSDSAMVKNISVFIYQSSWFSKNYAIYLGSNSVIKKNLKKVIRLLWKYDPPLI